MSGRIFGGHSMGRRAFLKRSIALASTVATLDLLTPALALAEGKEAKKGRRPVLVVVFLRGGIDALHAVVPLRDPRYAEVRPTLAVPLKSEGTAKAAVPLDKRFGLHPALEPLFPLYEKKLFAPILGTGSPHPSRSHFDCMDFMETAAPGDRTVRTGWLNRLLSATPTEGAPSPLRAVAMQSTLPVSLRGEHPVLAVPELDGDPLGAFDPLYGGDGAAMGGGEGAGTPMGEAGGAPGKGGGDGAKEAADPLLVAGRHTIEAIRRFRELSGRKSPGEAAAGYPQHPFADKLRELARVIEADAGLEAAAIDYPGWDHHAEQGTLEGTMPRMLAGLAGGLAAFSRHLGDRMQDVLVLTMSEFGRTVHENGTGGTDHGHGGLMLAVGGRVKGGEVYGQHPPLEPKALFEERDLPAAIDFRSVMDEVIAKAYGLELPKNFFPGYRPKKGDRPGFLKDK